MHRDKVTANVTTTSKLTNIHQCTRKYMKGISTFWFVPVVSFYVKSGIWNRENDVHISRYVSIFVDILCFLPE